MFMLDIALLQLITDNEGWHRYADLIRPATQEAELILRDMHEYRAKVGDFNWSQFGTWFLQVKHPTLKADKRDIYQQVFAQLANPAPVSDGYIETMLDSMNERYYANEIRKACEAVCDGRHGASIEDINELLQQANDDRRYLHGDDKHIVIASLDEIVEAMDTGHGLTWRLHEFNRSLGPLRKGDMVLLSARPEAGKTTMLASEVSNFAEQCKGHADFKDRPIVWFNNEEEGKKVKMRIMQAALGCTTKRIMNDPQGAMRKYEEIVGDKDRIIVYDNKRMHYKEIEKFLAKHNPCVIVYDQLRKVAGFEKEGSEVQRLQQLYGKHARAMAAEYGPVLTVHQARGDAEGVLWVNGNQLEGCQTEVQGELDVQIMMGRSFEAGYENVRGLNIVKNKLLGGKDTEEALRHTKFEVIIRPEIARFVSP
jgi:replicative DNA helicase